MWSFRPLNSYRCKPCRQSEVLLTAFWSSRYSANYQISVYVLQAHTLAALVSLVLYHAHDLHDGRRAAVSDVWPNNQHYIKQHNNISILPSLAPWQFLILHCNNISVFFRASDLTDSVYGQLLKVCVKMTLRVAGAVLPWTSKGDARANQGATTGWQVKVSVVDRLMFDVWCFVSVAALLYLLSCQF